MFSLIDFLFGIAFTLFIMPIIEKVTTLVLTYIEALKSELNIVIARNNEAIEKPPKKVIGFAAIEEDDDDL